MPERNLEVAAVYEAVEKADKAPQKLLDEVCTRLKIDPVVVEGEYEDFVYQVRHDERFEKLLPEFLNALQGMRFTRADMSIQQANEIRNGNDKIVEEMARAIERNNIPLDLLENINSEIGQGLSMMIKNASQIIINRSNRVVQNIAKTVLDKPELMAGDVGAYEDAILASKTVQPAETAPEAQS